jgi:hypothetical protein
MTRDPQNGQNGAKSFFLSFVWIFILKSLAWFQNAPSSLLRLLTLHD